MENLNVYFIAKKIFIFPNPFLFKPKCPFLFPNQLNAPFLKVAVRPCFTRICAPNNSKPRSIKRKDSIFSIRLKKPSRSARMSKRDSP